MSIDQQLTSIRYHERFTRGAYFESSGSFVFPEIGPDSTKRRLELRLAQSETDEDSNPLDILLIPLKVLLTEEVEENGKISGYEDIYFFTYDGDFFVHGWRKYRREQGTGKIYGSQAYVRDGDMKKLLIYGEAIQQMLAGRRLDHSLDVHPTVQRLKDHTLWKCEPDPCK